MQTLIAPNSTTKDTEGRIEMVTKETSMQKHKRLMSQAREITDYAKTFGILDAMDRYDVSMPQTIQKIIKKGGTCEKIPITSKRSMFNTPQDYYDGIVSGIINRIVTLQTTVNERDQIIANLKAEVDDLKNKQTNHSALEMIRQEKGLSCLVNLIEEG